MLKVDAQSLSFWFCLSLNSGNIIIRIGDNTVFELKFGTPGKWSLHGVQGCLPGTKNGVNS